MADSIFVTPGVYRPFYIAARPGHWAEIRGEYEPMAVDDAIAWRNRAATVPVEQMTDYELETVCRLLKKWNHGPITPGAVRKMDGNLWFRLSAIVVYGEMPDVDPLAKATRKTDREDEIEKKDG